MQQSKACKLGSCLFRASHLQHWREGGAGLLIRGIMQVKSLQKSPRMHKSSNISVSDSSLTESLMQLLWDADGELVRRTVSILGFLFSDKDIQLSSPTALQLAEALQPLFDNADSSVQLSSILLFRGVMVTGEKEGKKALKPHVRQSLLPLFFHCHDENQRVAEASGEALLCVAGFLKRKDLKKVVKRKELWKFSKCLLEKDWSRVAEYLRQALPYLESPQEPLREAALRFMGMAGRYVRGQPEELQDIIETLQRMRNDTSLDISSLARQSCYVIEAAQSSILQTAAAARLAVRGLQELSCSAGQFVAVLPELWGGLMWEAVSAGAT
ncbi:maestro heat-like repeat-containing protein family member 6 [Pipra filicauda]|uniref:Maestro heat-like repeat-containing protein family member 6 n=1 Tax=Pipra filicauda TaxID=649802 RepID=A0A6J2J6F1_9PASS|nr:maestro heat-like repeat-containing protein family member 6 [Pipra filicauda]